MQERAHRLATIYVFGVYTTDPKHDSDQSGCEVPPFYDETCDDIDQLALFDDGDPTAPKEGAPAFWSNPIVQDFSEDDFFPYDPANIS